MVGGADTTVKGVLIKEIVPNTQADIDGQLRPGDRILQVCSCQTYMYSLCCETILFWSSLGQHFVTLLGKWLHYVGHFVTNTIFGGIKFFSMASLDR